MTGRLTEHMQFGTPTTSYGTPIYAGGTTKVAPSVATMMSQLMTSSKALPQTLLSTIARTGVDASLFVPVGRSSQSGLN